MGPEIDSLVLFGVLAAASITIVALVSLRGWRDWIALKRAELDQQLLDKREHGAPSTVSRIEVADLKERVKKLEAIAAGIDT